jgi:hypothetical protein
MDGRRLEMLVSPARFGNALLSPSATSSLLVSAHVNPWKHAFALLRPQQHMTKQCDEYEHAIGRGGGVY